MKKVLIVTAVMAFAMMLGPGVQSASADSVLFPYFASGGGDLTFVQIINTKAATSDESETLHYTYVYNTDTETCTHYDDEGDTSENDILLYEVTDALAPGASGQLLPGDTTSTSPVLTVSPAWGFLVVDNMNFGSLSDEGTIQGQSIQINTDDMTAYILNGINDPEENGNEGDERKFWYNTDNNHWLSFQPETFASTVWYIFPVERDDLGDPDPNTYGLENCSDLDECYVEIGEDAGGIYDNNESLKSGTPRIYPGCQYEENAQYARTGIPGWQSSDFFYTLDELLTGAQYNAVKNTGGWFDIFWDDRGFAYKIVSSDAFGATLTGMVYEPQVGADDSYTK